jgi:DNA-binding transcriptional regulator YiaG
MNTTQAGEEVLKAQEVLKTDVLGRVKTPAERREQVLDEFERSGLSGQKFAELIGVKYQTFATWVQKRRRQRGPYKALKAPARAVDQVQWLEAVVEQAQAANGTKHPAAIVQLPGGARVEVVDAKQAALVAALLRALEKPC